METYNTRADLLSENARLRKQLATANERIEELSRLAKHADECIDRSVGGVRCPVCERFEAILRMHDIEPVEAEGGIGCRMPARENAEQEGE